MILLYVLTISTCEKCAAQLKAYVFPQKTLGMAFLWILLDKQINIYKHNQSLFNVFYYETL